jgi:uncharacterized membrane protein YcaP (DUF421 family)
MTSLDTIFGSAHNINAGQECARAALILIYGLVLVRLTGRRTFGKWSALDIVVSVIAGSNLSRALTGSAPLWGTLAATTALMALHLLLAQAAARSSRLSYWLEGRASILAENGQLSTTELRRHSVSDADLDEALRQNGVTSAQETARITLEPSGRITLLKKKAK